MLYASRYDKKCNAVFIINRNAQRCAQIRRGDSRIARPYKAKRAIRESPLQNGGRYVPAVGRGLAPAVREDRYGTKKPRRVRDSEPRFAPGYGAVAALRQGAKPVQSPRALEGFESGTMIPKEKPPSSMEVFFWCTFRDSNPGPTD